MNANIIEPIARNKNGETRKERVQRLSAEPEPNDGDMEYDDKGKRCYWDWEELGWLAEIRYGTPRFLQVLKERYGGLDHLFDDDADTDTEEETIVLSTVHIDGHTFMVDKSTGEVWCIAGEHPNESPIAKLSIKSGFTRWLQRPAFLTPDN
jgi:hypothetical protein